MAGLTMALFKTPAGVKPPPSMPYLNWVLPGVSQFLEKEKQWLPVLVEFAKGTTLGSFRDGKIKLPGSARIPSLFMDEFLPAECQFCMFFMSGNGGSGPSSTIRCLPILPQRGISVASSLSVA